MARLESTRYIAHPFRLVQGGALVLFAVAMLTISPQSAAEEEGELPLETRVYNVADLVVPIASYGYQNTGIPSLGLGGISRPHSAAGGMGGGVGGSGMGSGGGLGGGGGGFFNVPHGVLLQMGGAGMVDGSAAPNRPRSQFDFDSLIRAIQNSIEPDTWEGGEAAIVPLGGSLIIAQTAPVHAKIEKLFKDLRDAGQNQRTVIIRATWLYLNAEQLAKIESSTVAGVKGGDLDPNVIADMAAKVPGYRGQISCFDNQTVHLVAGRGKTAITGAIPVVGSGAAYQPIVSFPQSGALLQVTPYVSPDARTAVVDIHSLVTTAGPTEAPALFLGASQTSEDGAKSAADTLHLDRVNLLAQQLMTTLRVPLGVPILVGGLSREPAAAEANAAENEQLYLFLTVSTQLLSTRQKP